MINLDELPMRVAQGQMTSPNDDDLRFIKQTGCDDFQLNLVKSPETGDGFWALDYLKSLVAKADEHQMRLITIENVPFTFHDDILTNGPRREEQLKNMILTIGNMGKAGIPILGYHFMPTCVWRTSREEPGPRGALGTSFNFDRLDGIRDYSAMSMPDAFKTDRDIDDDEMWENYDWFMERILPVCEEAGVRLALHPDDPPTEHPLGGVARIFRNFENFKRAMD
ncbi:MAG: mannonate dehydratase, partial [Lentisphaeria bacterium]|nr:mannonate dehydratase [Lentisphaeria bacterium]